MTKRASLFGPAAAPEPPAAPAAAAEVREPRKYQVASTREGKRVATVYLEPEALRQLQKVAFDEETTIQALLVEGINEVFAARGLTRMA